jgi:hypothetical protein
MTTRRSLLFVWFIISSSFVTKVIAGPPFKTDDPQPVDFQHWEFYVASMQQFETDQSNATLPHIEINYGVIPNVQLHLVAPLGYVHASNATHYGYSDTELGVKFKFVEETETLPQVGIFPLVELPTGDENKQLGSGTVQTFVPVWLQKTWGSWTTYGGGGIWFNPGTGQKDWGFAGWELQHDISKLVTLGGELCYQTASTPDAQTSASFNVGGVLNFGEENHLLFSVGHSMSGAAATSGYIAYQLTI